MKTYYLYDPTTDILNKECPIPEEQIKENLLSTKEALRFFKGKKDILDHFTEWNNIEYDELSFDITPAFFLDSPRDNAFVLPDIVAIGFNPILSKDGKNIVPVGQYKEFLNYNFYSTQDFKIVRYSDFVKAVQSEGYDIEPTAEDFASLAANKELPSFKFIKETFETKKKKRGY